MRRRTVARATMECWPLAPRRSARRTSGFFAPLFFPRSFRPSSASAALPSQLRRRGELFPRAPPCASRSPPGLPCFPRFYSSISMFASCYLSPSPFLPPPSFLASPPPPSALPSPSPASPFQRIPLLPNIKVFLEAELGGARPRGGGDHPAELAAFSGHPRR